MDIIKYNTTFGSEWDFLVVIAGIVLLMYIVYLVYQHNKKNK